MSHEKSHVLHLFTATLIIAVFFLVSTPTSGCGGTPGPQESTSGPTFDAPGQIIESPFDRSAATQQNGALIDTSHLTLGYISASATSESRLKLQVSCGDMSYNYDLPSDGTPISCPLNMGDGDYLFRVMQNTHDNNYMEIARAEEHVEMSSEFEPFLRPNVFCDYGPESSCVAEARKLTRDATNQGEVMRLIYIWIRDNIQYDTDKASSLARATGYIPSPDSTLSTGSGICFDYAALAAAMFRSLGIPCKIITGYVGAESLYHAWNMVYIDGEWKCVEISVDPNTWTRIDLTFASAGALDTVGNGESYTDRYVY